MAVVNTTTNVSPGMKGSKRTITMRVATVPKNATRNGQPQDYQKEEPCDDPNQRHADHFEVH
jgi:hypothetical protein